VDALLQAIAQPLHAAAKGILGQAERRREPAAIGDLAVAFAFVIVQQQRPGLDWHLGETAIETVIERRVDGRLDRHRRGLDPRGVSDGCHCGLPTPLEKHEPRDAKGEVTDVEYWHLFGEAPREPIQALVGAFVRGPPAAPVEEFDERSPETLVLQPGLLPVGMKPGEEAGQPLGGEGLNVVLRSHESDSGTAPILSTPLHGIRHRLTREPARADGPVSLLK